MNMRQGARSTRVLMVAAFAASFVFAPGAGAAGGNPPTSPLDNTHPRQVCAIPKPSFRGPVAQCDAWALAKSNGRYVHLSGTLVRHHTAVAATSPSAGPNLNVIQPMWPSGIHAAYGLPTTTANSHLQTVAIVDAFNDPAVQSDLNTYDSFWGLPALPPCAAPSSTRCLEVVNHTGASSPLPAFDAGWALEISLDVEAVHTICQDCKIILVEASSANLDDLAAATNKAASLGVDVISNSYGVSEGTDSSHLQQADFNTYAPDYRHPGVIVVASSGDDAFAGGTQFPADVNDVVAVGGTTLASDSGSGAYGNESVWFAPTPLPESGAGSGCSMFETPQAWQSAAAGWAATGCGSHRGVADVSADADPNSGLFIWNTVSGACNTNPNNQTDPCWWVVGGTSLAAPIIAATFALADNLGVEASPYVHSAGLHDVTTGTNADSCATTICMAAPGYDGPTGLGTPNGLSAFSFGAPVISSFSPTEAVPGTAVTITGSNFTEATAVTFGGTSAQSFSVHSDTQITAVVGAHTSGAIGVTTPVATGTSSGTFTIITTTITGFSPNGGPASTPVTITGKAFTGATMVKFGGTDASTFHVDSDHQITATTAGTNTGPISVVAPSGTGTSSALFYGPPSISSLSASPAAVHSTVTVNGSNLTGASHVTLGGVNCPFTVQSLTKLTLTVPTGASTGTIQITTPGGTATSGTLTVSLPPSISGFDVSSGPIGTTVTINGSNLQGTVGVQLGSVVTVPTNVAGNGSTVTFTIPPGAVTGPVRILNPAGSATSPGPFTVTP